MEISTILKGGLGVLSLCAAFTAGAGNIPQYAFKETRPQFEFLTDATPVKVTFGVADEMIFKDRQTLNAFTGQGFPIGFDFKYGGRVFNQFAIDNNGYILLGYDKVEFRGYSNLFFSDSNREAENYFYLGMGPIKYGIAEGEISYKLDGEEGDRTLTIQFAHMGVNEPTRPTRGNAIYSLQLVLSEKDGSVKMNFLEEESPYASFGLICGITGWGGDDTEILTSKGLGDPAELSASTASNMLREDTYLNWDENDILGDGHEEPYSFSFTFTPTGTPDFVCKSPTNLSVEQIGSSAFVSCSRSEDAPATAILFSESPILEFPTQGISYQVKNDEGEFTSTFGGATLIYYSNDENPVAEFPNLKASTRYYVKAFGVNGYPSYSNETSSDLEFMSSHPAPYVLQATSADGAINLRTIGDDDVIIASTLNRVEIASEGASGIFGFPEDDCAVGDMIEGGGEIIYIGEPGEVSYEEAAPNRQVFFRAWSLRDGRVSKTSINASGVTNPEMPYDPKLELYTLYETPLNWIAQTTSTETTITTNFMPRTRGANDEESAVAGMSLSSVATLTSPTINFGKNAKLKFEWAMETVTNYDSQAGSIVQLPEGNKPGEFGTGHKFSVKLISRGNEEEIFSANEYKGTMTPSQGEEGRFISGTSTFIPVEVFLGDNVTTGKVSFSFSTQELSILYLRNIMIEGDDSSVESIFTPESSDIITAGEGNISILSAKGGEYNVYSLDGTHAASVKVNAGEGVVIPLSKGIYVVNNSKVIVK